MRPYLEVPLCIQNIEGQEKVVSGKILPEEIAYYYPGFYDGIVCVTKSGQSYLLDLKEQVFEAMLEAYSRRVKDHDGTFGVLRVEKMQMKSGNTCSLLTSHSGA